MEQINDRAMWTVINNEVVTFITVILDPLCTIMLRFKEFFIRKEKMPGARAIDLGLRGKKGGDYPQNSEKISGKKSW